MPRAPSLRAVAVLSGAAALAALFAASGPACLAQGRCEFNTVEMCTKSTDGGVDPPCRGRIIDEKTWELVPTQGEDWVEFPAQRNWVIPLRDAKTGKKLEGEVIEINTWIATEKNPFWQTTSGGNLSEYGPQYGPDVTKVQVHNDTCAPYYLRVLVRTTGPAPLPDAGSDAPSDAPSDAASDASDAGTSDAADATTD